MLMKLVCETDCHIIRVSAHVTWDLMQD